MFFSRRPACMYQAAPDASESAPCGVLSAFCFLAPAPTDRFCRRCFFCLPDFCCYCNNKAVRKRVCPRLVFCSGMLYGCTASAVPG